MKSIQARLAIGLGGSLIILFVLQWAIVHYFIRHVTDEIIHARLQQDADTLISTLIVLDSGKISLPFTRISDVYHRPFSGHYYRIDGPVNTLRSRSLWDEDLPDLHLKLGEHRFVATVGPLGQKMFTHAQMVQKNGKNIVINIAHEVSDLESDVTELQYSYVVMSILAFLVLLTLQTGLVRTSLKPVRNTQKEIMSMRRGDIGKLDDNVPTEMQPLVREINRLVNLLGQRIQRSRNSLGNLAHALKAPLTVITQIANEKEIREMRSLRERLVHQTQFMQEMIERELKRARLAGTSEPGRYFNLEKDIGDIVSMLETIYRDKDLAMDINVQPGVSVPLDREDLMELVGNLLDNACKHARNLVRLNAVTGKFLLITVEDDGPGVAADKIEELTKRGTRIDESKVGHGLGLAIVTDTVKHYGGTVDMGRSGDLGGFRIRICLPVTNTQNECDTV